MSFEWDYTNVLTLLRLAGLPLYAAERTERHPLVVIGGAVTFVNPEPLALFADVIAAGEGEMLVPDLVDAVRNGASRADVLTRLTPGARLLHPVVLRRRATTTTGRLAAMEPRAGHRARRRSCARPR